MRRNLLIGTFIVLAAAAAWCVASGRSVDQIGVDAITAATKPHVSSSKSSSSKSADQMTPDQKAQAETLIIETTFRYMFGNEKAATNRKIENYYIGFGVGDKLKDPPKDIIAHFEGNTPTVKPQSESKRASDGSVVDKTSSKPGLLFRVEGVKWVNATSVEVGGGCVENSKSSTTEVFKVSLKNKTWVVTESK